MKTTLKPRLTSEQVMQQVFDKTKGIVDHCYLDRDWIWYCGPSLQGEVNKSTREALKAIGFRYAPGGHEMNDPAKTRGSWGHSCHKPTATFRKGAVRAGHSRPAVTPPVDHLAALAAMFD